MQVGVFSATLPPEALEITRKFMNKPVSNEACLAVPSDCGTKGPGVRALLSFWCPSCSGPGLPCQDS